MTEWQGAVLSAQLERFPEQNRTRNRNAVALGEALGTIEGTSPQRRDPRMDSQGNYCFVFHYDSAAFAGLGLRLFERALNAEGVPMSVSYPSLNELEIFRSQNFGRRFAGSSPAIDYRSLNLPRAQHAAASTVWLQHRLLLGEREAVLDVALAIARIQKHAKRIGATVNA
jgi:dTDP-4-amino-4,6-dideoxygalactose transaminase